MGELSDTAQAYHSEFWWWLWHGKDGCKTISEKRRELREKYGDDAEREVVAELRRRGFLAAQPEVREGG